MRSLPIMHHDDAFATVVYFATVRLYCMLKVLYKLLRIWACKKLQKVTWNCEIAVCNFNNMITCSSLCVFRSKSLETILKEFDQKVTASEGTNIVNVVRENVLDGAIRGFSRVSFNPWRPLSVKFAGEDGIDEGGPCREFMRLVVERVQAMPIFCGQPRSRMITLDAASKWKWSDGS